MYTEIDAEYRELYIQLLKLEEKKRAKIEEVKALYDKKAAIVAAKLREKQKKCEHEWISDGIQYGGATCRSCGETK